MSFANLKEWNVVTMDKVYCSRVNRTVPPNEEGSDVETIRLVLVTLEVTMGCCNELH